MKIGKYGVWFSTNALDTAQLAALAQGVERLNYDVLWYPESLSYESLALGGFLLGQTDRLCLGSGIANIYGRDAVAAMAGHDTLNTLYGDRFILGLGVSHIPLVEGRRGHAYGKPVATMRAYLDSMAAAELAISAPARNVVLAALGPNMLALARDRAAGALPYNVTPEHTAEAKKILGPDAWLCVEQKICFTSDPKAARDVAAANMARYMATPNYRNNWLRLGFSEDELSGRGSDRFLDAMVVWGSEEDIRSRIDAHFAAGATHVCIQPLDPSGAATPDWSALEAFSPGG
ncbi:MAG: TIGR03620 family F420-dependent LLM class oxidoreductase [Alphaproteobacteria bacterium]|nr:TIGR03620 family F420-dependent LLM class oxidoreductase [Alphaproteobacteria bacterium]